jgi:hypothetical protein
MVDALHRVSRLDRADCRAAAELRFSRRRMVADHEQLYRRLLVARDPVTVAESEVQPG